MIKDFINKNMFTKFGTLNCTRFKENWYDKNGYTNEYTEILTRTKFLDESYTFSARIYCILNDIIDVPKCDHCSKNVVSFKNFTKGFLQYCSMTCVSYSETAREKKKITNLERYGVEFHTQAPEIRDKMEKSMIKNHGVLVPIHAKSIKDKIENTNNERYGSAYGFGSEIIQDKVRTGNLERYGANVPNSNPEVIKHLSNRDWLERELSTKNTKTISEELGCSRSFINVWARTHGIENRIRIYSEENEIYEFLDKLGLTNIERNIYGIIGNPKGLGRRELDLYIPDKKIAIELNGVYWHSGDEYRHIEKLNLCRAVGIRLLQFWDFQWNEKDNICKSIIKSRLGINEVRYARKCSIIELSSEEYRQFLNNNHLQGAVNSSIRYGLMCGDELVSVIGFSKSRYDKECDWELVRYANKCGINVVGGFSKLLNRFRNEHSGSIISYCDLMIFDGKMYNDVGFLHIKDTDPGYFYSKGVQIVGRECMQKHKLKDTLKDFDERLTGDQNLLNHGWEKVWNCGNGVWKLL